MGRFFITILPRIVIFLIALIAPAAHIIWKLIFRVVLFPLYLAYKPIKIRIQKLLPSVKRSVWAVFFTRYLVHGFIAILILFVTTQNIFAKGDPGLFEGNSVIAQILGSADDQNITIEDVTSVIADPSAQINLPPSTSLTPDVAQDSANQIASLQEVSEETSSTVLNPSLLSDSTEEGVRTSTEEYIVQGGDTISSIAENFGVSAETVLWANNLNDFSIIRPGDKLSILPVSGVSHAVKNGDTLQKIASRYNANVETIIEFNRLADENDLKTGETLIIPNGTMPEAPKPAPKKSTSLAIRIPNVFNPPPSVKVAPSSRMVWPTVYRKINQYYRGWLHTGVDIDCNYGIPLYAAASGTVERAGWASGYGLSVTINHGGGKETLYGHSSKLFVRAGQKVSKGQTIAMCGSTGRSTGTHLHFEVIINGKKVNPLSYL